jgi:hypothetical protein
VAILDLLRRMRQDEEEEDEDIEGAEDADEETEDETIVGRLLATLSRPSNLGRLFQRGGRDEDEEEDDGNSDGTEDEDETGAGESAGGLLNRFMKLSRLGGMLRRAKSEDEDEDEDEAALPVAIVPAQEPQLQTTDGPEAVEPETEVRVNMTSPQSGAGDSPPALNYQPSTGHESMSENGDKGPDLEEAYTTMSPSAMRLRELAQSQEDVPVEELADDLHNLLNLLGGRRR